MVTLEIVDMFPHVQVTGDRGCENPVLGQGNWLTLENVDSKYRI